MPRSLAIISLVALAHLSFLSDTSIAEPATSMTNRAVPAPAPVTLIIHPELLYGPASGPVEAERGMLFVPTNRANPDSGVIAIEIYRFPRSADASPDVPPIFKLHGGPGWPGLGDALFNEGYYEEMVEPYTRVSDLVLIGQRGIGSSSPDTLCQDPPADAMSPNLSEDELATLVRDAATACRDFWLERGLDLDGFTVIEAAADVDDARKALGYEQITLMGGSFGSHWGMAVMRFHPEIVARAILTGMEGPDHTYDDPAGILKVLERVAADAEDSAQLEGLVPEGGFVDALATVIRQLDSDPISVTVTNPETEESIEVLMGGDDLREIADGFLGRVEGRRPEASWPAGVLALQDGDFEAAAARVARSQGQISLPTASFFMLDCGSGITAERDARFVNDPARDIVGDQNWYYREICPIWNSDLGDDFRQNFETTIPTVIIHGDWDLSTPLENALELAPYFKNGRMVLVRRGSHGAMREALRDIDGFREALDRFIVSGDMSDLPESVELDEPDWVVPE